MTLDQLRADNALGRVNELAGKSDGFKKCYRVYVDRLCPTILMNGLGQALASELAAAGSKSQDDDEQAHSKLYENLQLWLCRADGGFYPKDQDLLSAITTHEEEVYLCAQAEALAWLVWHKKFCRATFPRDEKE